MATLTSNRAAVFGSLRATVKGLGFDRPGSAGKPLGQEADEEAARQVYQQTVGRGLSPDNTPLARLAPSTLDRKRRLGFPSNPLVATGFMLNESNLRGTFYAGRTFLEITYGTSARARKLAEWATRGFAGKGPRGGKRGPGSWNKKMRGKGFRPPRPFFGLSAEGYAAVARVVREGLDAQVRRGPGG